MEELKAVNVKVSKDLIDLKKVLRVRWDSVISAGLKVLVKKAAEESRRRYDALSKINGDS